MPVPMLDLVSQFQPLKAQILKVIEEVADSQRFILGPKVEELEAACNAYCQTAGACGVTSGSDGLILALMAEKIGPGDEVIIPTFTFFATAGAVVRVGATPVFADIDPATFNIDPDDVARKITPRTRAMIPVHLFGQCADMDPLMALAEKHGLIVIEDACQAIGSEYKGRRAGSIGDYGVFSFFPSKNLGCFGDGGLVTVRDAAKLGMLKTLRNHGQSATYVHEYVGGNFRIDALQAAILSIKLPYLDSWSEARQRNAAEYRKLFADAGLLKYITLPAEAAFEGRHIYNQFSILVRDGKRDALRAHLAEKGIGAMIYYPLSLHLQPCFANFGGKAGDCPVSERVSGEILALPIYPESTSVQRAEVVAAIQAFYNA